MSYMGINKVWVSADRRSYFEYDPGNSRLNLYVDDVLVGYHTSTGFQLSSGMGLIRPAQKRLIYGYAKAGATAGWVVNAATNVGRLATCPASQTASTLVIPIPNLKVGDTITSFHLVGQIESAGGTVTVDAALRKITAAAADVTDALVASMTQLSVTADTIMSASNTDKTGLSEVVGADETFYLLVTCTTGASTDIDLMGIAVTVTES